MIQIIQAVVFWMFAIIAAAGMLIGGSVGLGGAAVIVAGSQDPGSTRWMKVGFAMMAIGSGVAFLLNPY